MTVTGDGAGDEQSHVDRQPSAFPQVGDSNPGTPSGTPALFSQARPSTAETSAIATKPIPPAPAVDKRGSSRLRWIVGGSATLLVVATLGGVLFLAAPHAGAASATAHYAPADTGMYAEVRLDLPGDQRDNLATFMSHFPGFADQAAFQQKLDETLNTLLTDKSNGALDWNTDVKPWFGGQLAVFGDPDVSPTPTMCAAPCPDASTMSTSQSVIVFTVSDKSKLQSVIDSKAGSSQISSDTYQGQQINTIAQPAGMSRAVSYVITDDALLAAPNVDLLKQALDAKAGSKPALADDTFFTQQLATLHADRLGTFYVDAAKAVAAMPQLSDSPLSASCLQITQAMAGVKYVGELRAESDHLAFNIRGQMPTGDNVPPAPRNKQTTLAQSMPNDTTLYFEARNAGANLGWMIKNLLACSSAQSGGSGAIPSGLDILGGGNGDQIFEQFLGAKPEDFFDFLDDVALGVSYTNDKVSGGIVATVDDQAVATQRVDKLVALLQMVGQFGGAQSGTQITTQNADHNGVKVTTVTVTAVAQPDGGAQPVTFQVATANNRLYLGLNDFVTGALDRQATDSLASSARYQKAISDAPADNSGILYIDVAGALAAYEDQLPADKKQDFESNKKPFLDPLSSFSVVSHIDGGMVVTNGFLFVE